MAKQVIKEENILVQRIAEMLNTAFHGGAWHGPSVMEATKGLSPKEASYKFPSLHTIAELVYHMTSWRLFAVNRMQGDESYTIDDKKNFGNTPKVDAFELETLLMELSLSQDELMKELKKKEDAFLDEIVPGSEYSFYTLIHGIIQHDIYHTGQIMLLKKMSAASPTEEEEDDLREDFFEDGYDDNF